MGLADRSARAWASGQRQPEKPGDVARAIVAVAHGAGLGLATDEHLRAEEICGDLLFRATAVQAVIVVSVAVFAEHYGGVRALARAMAGEDGPDLEPTVRRWLGLGQGELRSIIELNHIVARLAKFSRSEIRKKRRPIRVEPGPVGERQAILAHIAFLHGADKPVELTQEEILAFLVLVVMLGLLAIVLGQVAVQPIPAASGQPPNVGPSKGAATLSNSRIG
jgi:hypothetical protein